MYNFFTLINEFKEITWNCLRWKRWGYIEIKVFFFFLNGKSFSSFRTIIVKKKIVWVPCAHLLSPFFLILKSSLFNSFSFLSFPLFLGAEFNTLIENWDIEPREVALFWPLYLYFIYCILVKKRTNQHSIIIFKYYSIRLKKIILFSIFICLKL